MSLEKDIIKKIIHEYRKLLANVKITITLNGTLYYSTTVNVLQSIV